MNFEQWIENIQSLVSQYQAVEQEFRARKETYFTLMQQITEAETHFTEVVENTRIAEERYAALLAQIEELPK